MDFPAAEKVRTVAVVGAGTIGASWAAWFLARGCDVVASDPASGGEAFVRRFVAEAWPALIRLGLAAGADPGRLRFTADPVEAACLGDMVQESAPERLELKQELLGRIDAALAPERVIASSTSGFTVSAMQVRMRHPERLVVGHPFNPPHVIPLVEVVGGGRTAEAAVDWALAFYRAVGKHPIRILKEVPGHLANRLQMALWREAVHMVAEGVASVADVDAAIALGPGLRWAIMGPALTFHLAGGEGGMAHFLDHFGGFMEARWRELGSPKLTPELGRKLIDGVAEEAAGRSVTALAGQRDACLLDILAALAQHGAGR
ncbi:MAG TPA: 3-hydroxyacyl-CoA dehydrogenase NAD-binding domain-containing protein [Candidatus Sulfotelmatobacter sp.]|nr:3-hydroxyacyl-CoA dehydrogenase NAD-binding domain-containing protein [Candidatus Sulfotelmatobacter sp.]